MYLVNYFSELLLSTIIHNNLIRFFSRAKNHNNLRLEKSDDNSEILQCSSTALSKPRYDDTDEDECLDMNNKDKTEFGSQRPPTRRAYVVSAQSSVIEDSEKAITPGSSVE